MNKIKIDDYYEPESKTSRYDEITISFKENLIDYIDKLQQENKQLKIQISAREEEYMELEDKYKELNKMCELYSKSLYNAELNKYKDNWNKLKKYLFDIRKRGFALQNLANVTKNTEPGIAILIIINKIRELEQGKGNE